MFASLLIVCLAQQSAAQAPATAPPPDRPTASPSAAERPKVSAVSSNSPAQDSAASSKSEPTLDYSNPATLTRLAVDLQAEDANLREASFDNLCRAPKALATKVAKGALESRREETRLLALKLLRRTGAKDLGRDLAGVLVTDPSDVVRREACHTIVGGGREQAPTVLLRVVLRDKALGVRRSAVHALGRVGSLEAAESLVQALEQFAESGDDPDDKYLEVQVTKALTLATGESFGANLEAWQHFVAELRTHADEPAAAKEAEQLDEPDSPEADAPSRDEDVRSKPGKQRD